jgi:hypothetical protein
LGLLYSISSLIGGAKIIFQRVKLVLFFYKGYANKICTQPYKTLFFVAGIGPPLCPLSVSIPGEMCGQNTQVGLTNLLKLYNIMGESPD